MLQLTPGWFFAPVAVEENTATGIEPMTDGKTGETVRLTVDNWLGLIALLGGLIGAIVYQTTETAKLGVIVDRHTIRMDRIEDKLDSHHRQRDAH